MRRALGPEASEQDVARALDYFIRYYNQHCLDETVLYPGTREMLDELRAADRRLAILTNKPMEPDDAEREILRHATGGAIRIK